jgi:uncharacterized protein YjbI with pentapeptide repeats
MRGSPRAATFGRYLALLIALELLVDVTGDLLLERMNQSNTRVPPSTVSACTGKFAGRSLDDSQLREVLKQHSEWYAEVHQRSEMLRNLEPTDGKGFWRLKIVILTESEALDPRRANLCGARLNKAELARVNLQFADLSEATLSHANLKEANLSAADLSGAALLFATLTGAELSNSRLIGASLHKADLEGASLMSARLNRADLSQANLRNARFLGADVEGVQYRPQTGALPELSDIAGARNLDAMSVLQSQSAVELRDALAKGGFTESARLLTYAIRHQGLKLLPLPEYYFNYVLFDLPSRFGASPGRPLRILFFLIYLFAIPYLFALTRKQGAGIWKVWSRERVVKSTGLDEPLRLNPRGVQRVTTALYFSLLSAASIGWRDLNLGNWLTRIQADEYTLRATGWVRSVSGIQSLLSVYLFALWALTYFGRPFD